MMLKEILKEWNMTLQDLFTFNRSRIENRAKLWTIGIWFVCITSVIVTIIWNN